MDYKISDKHDMVSSSAHLNAKGEGDPEAQEYMQGLYDEKLQGLKWIRRGAAIILLGQIICWWGLFPLPSADWIIRRMIVSFFPFGPVIIPFWVWVVWHTRSYRKDARHGKVKSISGSYEKSRIRSSSSPGHPIKIKGEKVLIPLSDWKSLPDKGTITAEYFPHTRLCWRLEDRKVRDTK